VASSKFLESPLEELEMMGCFMHHCNDRLMVEWGCVLCESVAKL